jgi:hypothetical protein
MPVTISGMSNAPVFDSGESIPPFHWPVRPRSFMVWLFLSVCLAYLLTAGSNFASGDSFAELRVTQSLVEHGSVNVPIVNPNQVCAGWGCRGISGRYFASHGIGFSVLLVPFYLSAKAAVQVLSPPRCGTWDACVPIHLISWSNCALSALTVVLLCALCLDLGYSLRRSVAAALIYGFATLAWPYARFAFDVSPTTLLLLAAFREGVRAGSVKDGAALRLWALAGVLGGLAILVRLPTMPALAPLALWTLLSPAASGYRARVRRLIAFLLPLGCSLVFSAWYNLYRFGSIVNDGHAANAADRLTFQPWVGIVGMTISPGKGMLWYCPAIIFALIGVPRFIARHGIAGKLALSMATLSLLPYLFVPDWYGGDAWGPRFVIPVLPLILLPALEAQDIVSANRRRKAFAWAILIYSVMVQLAGQLVSYPLRLRRAAQLHINYQSLLWDPRHSPLLDHLGVLFTYITHPGAAAVPVPLAESFDIWWLNLWRIDGLPRMPVLLAAVLMLSALVLCGWFTVRSAQAAAR